MLSRVLGNHSKILALNELHYFGDLCNLTSATESLHEPEVRRLIWHLLDRQAHGLWGAGQVARDEAAVQRVYENLGDDRCTAYDAFGAVCAVTALDAGKSIACEQTPRNIYYGKAILEAFPLARIVHLVRDPRAVTASQKNRWQLRRLGAVNVPRRELVRTWINYHPVTMAKLWRHATLKAAALAGHPRMRIVLFEDLVQHPRRIITELCDFIGIDFEPAMLDVPKWGSSNIRHESASGGISIEVVGQWKSILDAGEVEIIERLTSDQMTHFGYQSVERRKALARVWTLCYWAAYPLHLAGVILANPRRAWIQLSAIIGSRRQFETRN